MSTGLQRDGVNVYNAAEDPVTTPPGNDDDQQESGSEDSDDSLDDLKSGDSSPSAARQPSKRKRIKAKAKKFFHIGSPEAPDGGPPAPTLAPMPKGPGDDESERLTDSKPDEPSSKEQFKEMMQNPIDTIQSMVRGDGAEKVAKSMETAITHGADVQLVRAHDKAEDVNTKKEEKVAMQEVDKLKEARQDSFVRWTFDKHVREVKSVPAEEMSLRSRKEFVVTDERGVSEMQWREYGHHVCLLTLLNSCHHHRCFSFCLRRTSTNDLVMVLNSFKLLLFWVERYGSQYVGASSELPSASQDAIQSGFERLLLSSTPCQEAFMNLRSIYRWEDPKRSARWLMIYFTLWTFNCLAGFAVKSNIPFASSFAKK